MLRQRVSHIDACCARRLAIKPVAGAMMRKLIAIALDEGATLQSSCRVQLGRAVIEAIATAALEARELADLRQDLRRAPSARIVDIAIDYIERLLGNSVFV